MSGVRLLLARLLLAKNAHRLEYYSLNPESHWTGQAAHHTSQALTAVQALNSRHNVEDVSSHYLSASGKPEKPVEVLFREPVVVGSLTLEIDTMVMHPMSGKPS